MMKVKKIVFIGYRGSGKTTLSRRLAEKLKWQYLSSDAWIEQWEGVPIAEIVAHKGWSYFRDVERRVIQELSQLSQVVIDCGGGVVEDEQNMRLLKKEAFVVWVDADPEVLLQRLQNDGQRPLLNQSNFRDDVLLNYRRRYPIYQQYAQLRVDTSQSSPDKCLMVILKELSLHEW